MPSSCQGGFCSLVLPNINKNNIDGGDGTNNNIVKLGYRSDTNAIYTEVKSASASQVFLVHTTTDITNTHKVAVKYKKNDFAGCLKHPDNLTVRWIETSLTIGEKNDAISFFDCQLGLFPYLGRNGVRAERLKPSGINEHEFFAMRRHIGVVSIPRQAGQVVNNGFIFSNQSIKESRLPYIFPSHNGNQGLHKDNLY